VKEEPVRRSAKGEGERRGKGRKTPASILNVLCSKDVELKLQRTRSLTSTIHGPEPSRKRKAFALLGWAKARPRP